MGTVGSIYLTITEISMDELGARSDHSFFLLQQLPGILTILDAIERGKAAGCAKQCAIVLEALNNYLMKGENVC